MGNTQQVYRTRSSILNVPVGKIKAGSRPEWTHRTSNISIAHKVASLPTTYYSKPSCVDIVPLQIAVSQVIIWLDTNQDHVMIMKLSDARP